MCLRRWSKIKPKILEHKNFAIFQHPADFLKLQVIQLIQAMHQLKGLSINSQFQYLHYHIFHWCVQVTVVFAGVYATKMSKFGSSSDPLPEVRIEKFLHYFLSLT